MAIPECISCAKKLTPEVKSQKHGKNATPTAVPCCWDCWSTMSAYQRSLITIAITDRLPGGVLAEMAAALDRIDLSKMDEEPGEDWKQL
jgi:hypothetical protein